MTTSLIGPGIEGVPKNPDFNLHVWLSAMNFRDYIGKDVGIRILDSSRCEFHDGGQKITSVISTKDAVFLLLFKIRT